MIGNLIRRISVSDVDLDDYEVVFIVEIEFLDVFILQRDVGIGIEIGSESC